MNKVRFMGYSFLNEDITNFPTAHTHQALISSELYADEITLQLRYNPNYIGYYIDDAVEGSDYLRVQSRIYAVKSGNDEFPFTEYDNATPLDLYQDDTFLARYYITSIAPRYKKDGYVYFEVSAISFIGLTINMAHNGGLYVSTPIGDIVADILKATKDNARSTSSLFFFNMANNLYYTMDALVYNYRVSGRLPATDGETRTARDNIRDVLFASGASILKNADGSLYFTFNQPSEAIAIADEVIYIGQPYEEDNIITTVKVIANSYFAIEGVEEKTLFDSAGDVVDHAKVLFDEPIFRFSDTTLTINESGVNYAIVSGSGVLKGFEYTHTRQEYSSQIADGIENIATATNGLVSSLNYLSVLERMENYYKNARIIRTQFVLPPNVHAGSMVRFSDMFNVQKNGFIKDMDISYSGIDAGMCSVVVDWVPSNVGEGFTKCYVLQGSGSWSKAAAEAELGHAITKARVVLLGGGHGGYKGEDGGTASGTYPSGKGGVGGAGGRGGEGGRVNAVTIESNVPSSIAYNCGTGGQPAQEGNPTTASINGTTYSSADGNPSAGGVMNLITGDVYATVGETGYNGCHGGDATDYGGGTMIGEAFVLGDKSWPGGGQMEADASNNGYWSDVESYQYGTSTRWKLKSGSGSTHNAHTGGTCGSGAAYGSAGNKGVGGSIGWSSKFNGWYVGVQRINGTDGAKGADAQPRTDYVPNIAGGGCGGNGGGGGGLKGQPAGIGGYQSCSEINGPVAWSVSPRIVVGADGLGGTGSDGTQGGNGAVLIYV